MSAAEHAEQLALRDVCQLRCRRLRSAGRDRTREIDPRLPLRWEFTIGVLVVVSLGLFVYDWVLDTHIPKWVDAVEIAISCAFLIDFGTRLYLSAHRWLFFKHAWFELLAAIPSIEPFNTFRVIRLLRLVGLWRIGRRIKRNRDIYFPPAIGKLAQAILFTWATVALAFYACEKGHNQNVKNISDALWWTMTTLSTVGYGDISPVTPGGRLIGMFAMVAGVGLLGGLAATMASMLLELRDLGRKGLRAYNMEDHLLILNWNSRAEGALSDFFHDPRYVSTHVVIVADLPQTPVEDPRVRFVRGNPGRKETLERASASKAALAMVFPANAGDARSDHETALVVLALKRLNPKVHVAAELVASEHRDHLTDVGCDTVVDVAAFSSLLLVRCLQDHGMLDVVEDLLSNKGGSELYRVQVPSSFVGKTFRDYAHALLDDDCSLIGVETDGKKELNPPGRTTLQEGMFALVVARHPPA